MGKGSLASLPHQPEPLAACTRTRTLFGVLFLLILAKKKLGSQRFADGASRCDLSQEYLHVNRGSREPRTASRSYMKEVLKVDRGASWAPRVPAVRTTVILPCGWCCSGLLSRDSNKEAV